MKKLLDDSVNAARDALAGFAAAHPDLIQVQGLAGDAPVIVSRAAGPTPGKVGVISGGGSGHEPMHVGFIGHGMLDAVAPGPMFTAPTPDQILAAIKVADGDAGVLAIIKNYTGDVLNFEMGIELAQMEGIEVAAVIVADDVAVENSTFTAGRRGVAGTVLVEKIAGAAAARGDSLAEVTALAGRVCEQVRSMGVALAACTVPHVGRPSFDLPDDEVEIGIGIHGEPGRRRVPLTSAADVTRQLVAPILADLGLNADERVLLFVNGLGGTPLSELYVVYNDARVLLNAAGLVVERSLVGNFVTALEMQGTSITIMRLDDELVALWDAPVTTVALRW